MKKKKIFFWILFLILVLSCIFLFSPLFTIKAVEVSGNKKIKTEQIKEGFDYKNIFLFSEEGIKNDLLKKFPKIGNIEVKKNIVKRIVELKIEERERLGILCRMDVEEKVKGCFYIDKNGYVFEEAPETSGSLILLIKDYSQNNFDVGEHIFGQGTTSFISEIKEKLYSEANVKPIDFNLLAFPYVDLKVVTDEGWYIIFSLGKDATGQILALEAVLNSGPDELGELRDNKELEYIDLRLENRIYYK